jgi:hypothetical protein
MGEGYGLGATRIVSGAIPRGKKAEKGGVTQAMSRLIGRGTRHRYWVRQQSCWRGRWMQVESVDTSGDKAGAVELRELYTLLLGRSV